MPKLPVYNIEGQTVGEVELSEAVFAAPVNEPLMHEVVLMYLANQRQGTHATKTRGLVRGGGRKPWRQKHTGRARQGSIRAPHWKGGGTVFGPAPRDYGYTMPKKARRTALRSALTAKLQAGQLKVVDAFPFEAPKTKAMASALNKLEAAKKPLIVTGLTDRNVYLSARNIPGAVVAPAADLNVYQVLNAKELVFTRDAVARVEEVLGQ